MRDFELITVKFLGGAKKSFRADSMPVEKDELTVQELLDYLLAKKPDETMEFDAANTIVAINGADSAITGGKSAPIRSGDTVSIIPVIHGGSPRVRLKAGKNAEIFSVRRDGDSNVQFLDCLRKEFPRLAIQAISADYVMGRSHVQRILLISLYAQKHGIMLSKKLETDMLMRFAGTNQISYAISKVGIAKKDRFLLVAVGPGAMLDRMHHTLRPQLDASPPKKNEGFLMKEFGITKTHIRAVESRVPLEDILVERAAVLF